MKKFIIVLIVFSMFFLGIFMNIYLNSSDEVVITNNKQEEDLNAKDLKFLDSQGNQFSLDKISIQDKLVINFWASWCEPCKKEIPELNNFYDAHKNNEDIKIIGVAIDEINNVNKFIEEIPINFPLLIDEKNGFLLSKYLKNNKGVLPYTVIIDKDYQILQKFFGEISKEDLQNFFEMNDS
jgi:peroxiredoxin